MLELRCFDQGGWNHRMGVGVSHKVWEVGVSDRDELWGVEGHSLEEGKLAAGSEKEVHIKQRLVPGLQTAVMTSHH